MNHSSGKEQVTNVPNHLTNCLNNEYSTYRKCNIIIPLTNFVALHNKNTSSDSNRGWFVHKHKTRSALESERCSVIFYSYKLQGSVG